MIQINGESKIGYEALSVVFDAVFDAIILTLFTHKILCYNER